MNRFLLSIAKLLIKIPIRILLAYYLLLERLGYPYKELGIKISGYTGYLGNQLRKSFYMKTLAKCGAGLRVGNGSYFVYKDIEVGENVAIEEDCIISKCIIGDDVIFSPRTVTLSGRLQHDSRKQKTNFSQSDLPPISIIIGSNVWLGTCSLVMDNVPNNTIVGAGAVYVKDVKEGFVNVAGNPARVIRRRKN